MHLLSHLASSQSGPLLHCIGTRCNMSSMGVISPKNWQVVVRLTARDVEWLDAAMKARGCETRSQTIRALIRETQTSGRKKT